jgi:ParB-like chromosome segregation protein Spo0J
MTNTIQSIALNKLVPHPDNPNRMSKANFAKLVRNIKRTGRYEPLIVRPFRPPVTPSAAEGSDCFQIINGHHRAEALAQLGYETADVVVWDVDDGEVDILLATLNRLGGSDILDKKLALLKRLNARMQTNDLAKLLPQTAKQIERLTNLTDSLRRASSVEHQAASFANPLVFFLDDEQSAIVEDALFLAQLDSPQVPRGEVPRTKPTTKAGKRAAALTEIARFFLATSRSTAK